MGSVWEEDWTPQSSCRLDDPDDRASAGLGPRSCLLSGTMLRVGEGRREGGLLELDDSGERRRTLADGTPDPRPKSGF